jgi:L-asparaginase II
LVIHCNVYRGSEIESVHEVFGVAVDDNGTILLASGDPHYSTCIRSSLKPFQASVCIDSGAVHHFKFNKKELAIMCASHNGEDIHTSTVAGMLKKIDMDSSNFECGIHAPYDVKTRLYMYGNKLEFNPLHNNCSGKHTGILATAKHLGVPLTGYIEPNHPVQEKIKIALEKYSCETEFIFGVDGCSLPTPYLTLFQIATMYQKLASGQFSTLDTLYNAMVTHPYLVGGRKRFDTDFMNVMKGRAITKVGGEAVRGMGIRQNNGDVIGIALKVRDGNQRANAPGTMAFLKKLELLDTDEISKLKGYETVELVNHRKKTIGKIQGEIKN